MKVSLIQMKVCKTPTENLVKIEQFVKKAVEQGGDIIVLPEMCCCEYSNKAFVENAMQADSPFLSGLSDIARESNVILVGGTVPEKDEGRIYNTSFVFDCNGNVVAKHRKAHLFDIDIEGGIQFRESDTFSAGDKFTVFDTKWGKVGLIICFDIRFPEYIKQNSKDLKMIIVPASFNMNTGPAHWELLFKARAVDNQLYMIGCASAPDDKASYHSYGHSIITDPWGDVVEQLGTEENVVTCKIDIKKVDEFRSQLPLY